MRLVSTNLAETSLRTLMIGAIDRIEQKFGYLWGHDKDENAEFTEEEERLYEEFMELRESILDYGNVQICKIRGKKWEKKNQ